MVVKMIIARNQNELEFKEKENRFKKINNFNGKYFHGIKDKKSNKKLSDYGIKQIKFNYCPYCKSYNYTVTKYKSFCLNCGKWFENKDMGDC